MRTRWIIPGSLAAFAVLTSALWAWLSLTQKQITLERVAIDELSTLRAPRPLDPHRSERTSATTRSSITTASKRTRAPSHPAPALDWNALAQRADDHSVRIRLRAANTSYARSAAGWAHLDAGRPFAALAEFDRTLVRHPDDSAALKGRADALARLGRFEEAVDALRRVTRLQPGDADARYNCGAMLYRLSRFTEASEQFRELVALRPDDARAWFNLAGLAQRDGRLTEARDAWARFTSLQPDVADGWFNLGLARFDLGDPVGALFDFSCAAALAPDDPDTRLNMAAAWETLGDPHAALELLRDLHDHHPCDPVVEQALHDLQTALLNRAFCFDDPGAMALQHDQTVALPSAESPP